MKYKANDGIYAVVNGVEYMLHFMDGVDSGAKCSLCDFCVDGVCKASSWCRAVENAYLFNNAYWKMTEPVYVKKDDDKYIYAYCYDNDGDLNFNWTTEVTPGSLRYAPVDDANSCQTVTVDFGNTTYYYSTRWDEQ